MSIKDRYANSLSSFLDSLVSEDVNLDLHADHFEPIADNFPPIKERSTEASRFTEGLSALVGEFDVINNVFTTPANGTIIASQNPRRIALMFSAPAPNGVQISPLPFASTSGGIHLAIGTPFISILWRDFGAMVTYPWQVRNATLTNISVIESIWSPKR